MFSILSSEYILILVWIGFVALASRFIKLTKKETVIGYDGEVERYYWLFALIVIFPLIWMAGNRSLFGDTTAYKIKFLSMPDSISGIPNYLESINKDTGFSLVSCIIKLFVHDNVTLYFLIIAIFHGLSLLFVYRKYSPEYLVSIFLFIASADYISWMFNGIRQFTAVTLIFAATTLILKKKYLPVLLIVLLASTVHQSALLMIPFILIAYGKAWNKKTLLFVLLVLIAILFVGNFTDLLDESLSSTQYSNVVSEYKQMNDEGTNPLRVLVYSIPSIIAFFGRKKIKETGSELLNFCTNMSIISSGMYIISMFTSGIFFGRLPIYFSLYNYILLPWEIKYLFSKDNQKWIWPVMIVAYLLFYYYQMHLAWSLF